MTTAPQLSPFEASRSTWRNDIHLISCCLFRSRYINRWHPTSIHPSLPPSWIPLLLPPVGTPLSAYSLIVVMGQEASHAEPEELLNMDNAVQSQAHEQQPQPHSDAQDDQQEEKAEAADSEQRPSTTLAAGWQTLTRWLPLLAPFSGGNKKRRREDDDDEEHADTIHRPHSQPPPPAASSHSDSHHHKHIKLSNDASASSHFSPSHSCVGCDSLRAQVADLQQQLSHTRSLSSDLTCAVCHFLFLSPVTTECGHSWCLHCLVKSLQSKRQCPLCRSAITQRPIATALLLTSQLETAVSQLTEAEREERLKEQTRRVHEHIDYESELTRLVPPAARRTTSSHPIYDDGDGLFRCPWCLLEVQFADSCCSNECGFIDWSEEDEQHQWRQAADDDEAEEMDDFEEVDDFEGAPDPADPSEDDDEVTEPFWNAVDGSFSCMSCGDPLDYAQEYCCAGPIDWTEVYRAQADYDDEEDELEEEEVEEDDFSEGAEEDDFAELVEVDDDGFDHDDVEGEMEWVDGDDGDYLAQTMLLRRQILDRAGVEGDDEEVLQLMQQRRRGAAAAREASRSSSRRSRRRAQALASEYDAIRQRLLHRNEQAGEEDIQDQEEEEEVVEEVGDDIEEELAEIEAVDEEADIAELQAAVSVAVGDVEDSEAELDFVTGNGQRIARQSSVQAEEAEETEETEEQQSEGFLNETELEGVYWSGEEAEEPADAADDDDGEVEWTGSQQSVPSVA